MDIGNKIKQLRTRQGLTLEELASRSELTTVSYTHLTLPTN